MEKLPVIATFKDSVGYTLSNISLLFRAAGIWILLYFLANFALNMVDGGIELIQLIIEAQDPFSDRDAAAAKLFEISGLAWPLYILAIVISVFGYYSIAISWHRACLLDEVPPAFRLGSMELKYFGYSLAVGLIVGIVGGIGFFIVLMLAPILGVTLAMVLGGVWLLIVVMFSLRFMLVYPGVSVKDRRMSLMVSLETTKGNSWQLLGGTILCILPSLVVGIVIGLITFVPVPFYVQSVIMFIANLISGAFLLSFMSMCYQYFVPSPEAGDLG